MIIKKPKFWDSKNLDLIAIILFPLTIFTKFIILLFYSSKKNIPNIKTICIGNIYIGGTGKTPLSIKINNLIKSKFKTVLIKKFYLNQTDEQKMLRSSGNLICQKNRKTAINEAVKKNYEVAIFDDGLQDRYLDYNIKIVCFDSSIGYGNGLLLPAGPLRENLKSLKNCNIVFLKGKNKNKKLINKLKKYNKNLKFFECFYTIKNLKYYNNKKKYIIFSGIGNPFNFDNLLKSYNFKVSKSIHFPDHYNYKKSDIMEIKRIAKKEKLKILTTQKDYLRIEKGLLKNINYLKVDFKIKNEQKFLKYLIKKL